MTAPTDSEPRAIRILGIAGSLRRDSLNKKLLRAAVELAPAGMTVDIFERLGDIPPYNADVDQVGKPESVVGLVEAVRAADGLLVVTPEYNYSIPGVLKNAIDWVSRPPQTTPLKHKPAALMSASTGISGGMRAQYHLRQAFVFTETYVMLKPEVIIPKAAERFDERGRLADQSTRDFIGTFLVAFAAWTRRMSAVMVLVALVTLSACARLRSPIAPVVGPPPTFIASTSDVRGTRLIEVRDGTTKAAAYRAATDVLAKRYSVDVSDEHAGFLMTPWQASFMRDGTPDLRYRTRVMIRFLGDEWKQVSVRAQANWQRVGTGDEWDVGYDTQVLDDVSNDLVARIGKHP